MFISQLIILNLPTSCHSLWCGTMSSSKSLQVQVQTGATKMTNVSDIPHWVWNLDDFRQNTKKVEENKQE